MVGALIESMELNLLSFPNVVIWPHSFSVTNHPRWSPSITAQSLASIVGGFLFLGWIADRYGRKPSYIPVHGKHYSIAVDRGQHA